MAHNLNGYYNEQIDFTASNDRWILGKYAVLSAGNYGFYGSDAYDNVAVTVQGRVWGGGAAISSAGDNISIIVESSGRLLAGDTGVILDGANGSLRNAGDIITSFGVRATGEDPKISNTGLITTGGYAISVSYAGDAMSHSSITNGKTGEIHAGTSGIVVAGGPGGQTAKMINHGLIDSGGYAYDSDSANDRLINDGKMIGDISTGSGDDTIDTRGGTIKGQIRTGAGDDKLYTDRASHKLIEEYGDGIDYVYSSVSYKLSPNVESLTLLGKKDIDGAGGGLENFLHGNSGNNVLKGLGGYDELWGHKGNDKLYGGSLGDTFHFATGDGRDVIMDFQDGIDVIDIADWNAITSFSNLKNNHATDQGNDLLLHAGSDSILIKNVHKADLDAGDVYI